MLRCRGVACGQDRRRGGGRIKRKCSAGVPPPHRHTHAFIHLHPGPTPQLEHPPAPRATCPPPLLCVPRGMMHYSVLAGPHVASMCEQKAHPACASEASAHLLAGQPLRHRFEQLERGLFGSPVLNLMYSALDAPVPVLARLVPVVVGVLSPAVLLVVFCIAVAAVVLLRVLMRRFALCRRGRAPVLPDRAVQPQAANALLWQRRAGGASHDRETSCKHVRRCIGHGAGRAGHSPPDKGPHVSRKLAVAEHADTGGLKSIACLCRVGAGVLWFKNRVSRPSLSRVMCVCIHNGRAPTPNVPNRQRRSGRGVAHSECNLPPLHWHHHLGSALLGRRAER